MPRRPRADAVRNAEVLRAAAREVFAREGIQAPLDDVARQAGVSIGTLYNHYPRREHLVEAVVPEVAQARWEEIRDIVATSSDPADRWVLYLDAVFAVQASDRILSDAFADPSMLPEAAAASCGEVLGLGEALLAEARAAGVRVLLTPATLGALIVGNSVVQRGTPPAGWAELLASLARGS